MVDKVGNNWQRLEMVGKGYKWLTKVRNGGQRLEMVGKGQKWWTKVINGSFDRRQKNINSTYWHKDK